MLKKKKNQYLAHMTKTLVICKKYTYYKIKFAHYYLQTICCEKIKKTFKEA